MWAVQAKLLVGLLGGLLLSSIRSNPCTHTHMQVPPCMHACMGIDGCFFVAALSVANFDFSPCSVCFVPPGASKLSMAMKLLMVLLALQVARTPLHPVHHTCTPHTHVHHTCTYPRRFFCLLSFVQPRRLVSLGGSSSVFVVLSSAQVSLSIAALVEGRGDGLACPTTPQVCHNPVGAARLPGMSASSSGLGGGGGGGDPPEEPWKGILAELIYMCSGAVLLGVYTYTHLHLYK